MMDIKEHPHWFLPALKKHLFHHLVLILNCLARWNKWFCYSIRAKFCCFISLFPFVLLSSTCTTLDKYTHNIQQGLTLFSPQINTMIQINCQVPKQLCDRDTEKDSPSNRNRVGMKKPLLPEKNRQIYSLHDSPLTRPASAKTCPKEFKSISEDLQKMGRILFIARPIPTMSGLVFLPGSASKRLAEVDGNLYVL